MTETSETRHAPTSIPNFSNLILIGQIYICFSRNTRRYGLMDKFTQGKWVQFLVLPQTFANLLPLAVVVQE